MAAFRQHPGGGLTWFFYAQGNTIGQECWLNYFAWIFVAKHSTREAAWVLFKSFCNFFLSRCESKELDVEIRNLIERSGTSKSREDLEPIAQGSVNHQRTSCSPKVNTVHFRNCYLWEQNVPGTFPALVMQETAWFLRWYTEHTLYFFSVTATLHNEEVKMRRCLS